MADNTTLNPGTGGDVIRDVDKSGKKTQVVTLDVGGAGAEALISNSNPLPISDAGGSITVDGSVTASGTVAATQSGTWTVQPGNTANTTAWKVDGSAVTQPVSLAAGASAIAKAEDAASADADVGVPALAVRKATPANTSGTDGDYEFLQMSSGRLWASATIDAALPAGANAIGKLAANSGVTIGDVNVISAIPGTGATNLGKAEDAAHTSGDVGVMALGLRKDTPSAVAGTDGDYMPLISDQTGRQYTNAALSTTELMSAGAALTPKFAKITASSSGATTIISLVSSKKLRVLSWQLVCNAAVNVKWQSHVTPTDLTGLHYFAANGGITVPFNPFGHFETVAGEALDINLSGAVAVGGSLVYVEV